MLTLDPYDDVVRAADGGQMIVRFTPLLLMLAGVVVALILGPQVAQSEAPQIVIANTGAVVGLVGGIWVRSWIEARRRRRTALEKLEGAR